MIDLSTLTSEELERLKKEADSFFQDCILDELIADGRADPRFAHYHLENAWNAIPLTVATHQWEEEHGSLPEGHLFTRPHTR